MLQKYVMWSFLQETGSGSDEYMVLKKEDEAVHIEEPRRQETLPNQLHSCEAMLQE